MKILQITVLIGILTIGGFYAYSHSNQYGSSYQRGYGFCYEDNKYIEKELNLTKKQINEIDKINEQFRSKYNNNMGDRDKMWKLHDEHDKAIQAILTNEQQEKLDKILQNRRSRRHGRGFGRGARYCW